jgi:hypothetical protein
MSLTSPTRPFRLQGTSQQPANRMISSLPPPPSALQSETACNAHLHKVIPQLMNPRGRFIWKLGASMVLPPYRPRAGLPSWRFVAQVAKRTSLS